MTAYAIQGCTCGLCVSARRAARGPKQTCIYCNKTKKIVYVDEAHQRLWCKSCCEQLYVSCSVRKWHGRHDNATCPDCQDVAYVDRDEDLWLPLPNGGYAMNTLLEHLDAQGRWGEGHTPEWIQASYPPLRRMRFIIVEDVDIHELMETR